MQVVLGVPECTLHQDHTTIGCSQGRGRSAQPRLESRPRSPQDVSPKEPERCWEAGQQEDEGIQEDSQQSGRSPTDNCWDAGDGCEYPVSRALRWPPGR